MPIHWGIIDIFGVGFEVVFLSELGKFDGLKSEVSNEYESHASFLYGKKIAQKVVGVSINKKNDETWQWAQPCIIGKSNEPTKTIYYYAFKTFNSFLAHWQWQAPKRWQPS